MWNLVHAFTQLTALYNIVLNSLTAEALNKFDIIAYNSWNGYIRGLYTIKERQPISDECFGTWMVESILRVDEVAHQLYDLNFMLSYKDAR